MQEPGTAFVEVEGLVKRFGGQAAVDGVSLEVAEGHTLALLGPSGCGKTTILRCLAGLETPEQGFIAIAGRVVFDRAAGVNLMPEARALGVVFQSYAVWPHMSVAENVGFPLKVRGVKRAELRERVARILDLVGLGAWIDSPATQLSGGQQQRVALARALVHEPPLVLFDEPMSNLDAQLREEVRLELKVLQQRLGFTAIYVTHDQAEAFALAERIVVMNRGRIDTAGAPKDVFHRPATPFVARFLGLNVIGGTVAQVAAGPPFGAGMGERRHAAGYAQVALPGGAALWGEIGQDQTLRVGAPALLCVRKEHVGLCAADAARDDAAQFLSGSVKASSFLGLVEEYALDVGGVELCAVQPYAGVQAGDAVQVRLRPRDCIVLHDGDDR